MNYLKYICLAAVLTGGAMTSRAENVILTENPLSIKSFAVTPGESLDLVMYYNTSEKYIGAQFEIHLPEGISFAMDPDEPTELAYATVNSKLAATHDVSANLLSDGTYRAVLVSLKNRDIKSGDWIVMIPIEVSADFKGSGQGSLFGCAFSDHDRQYDYNDVDYFDVYVAPTALKLSESTATVTVSKTKTLTATYEPESAAERPLKWTSSDPDVATVSDTGEVTGVAKGTCTIKVELADNPAVSATCAVTVDVESGIETIIADGEKVDVYDIKGTAVRLDATADDLNALDNGVYIIKSATRTLKIHLRGAN